MLPRLRLVPLSVFLLSPLAGAPAQPQVPDEPRIILRSTTRMVQVNVLVQDKRGHPVADLTKDDFTVLDNGKAQQIAAFSMESRDKPRAPAAPLPPNVFTNRLEQRESVPNQVTVILLDALNTRWGDQMVAAKDVVAFLRQIQPGDRVALFGLNRSVTILHDYTSDSATLAKALAAWQGTSDSLLSISDRPHPFNPDEAVMQGLVRLMQDEAEFATEVRIRTSLKALEAIANHVATIPGRKNLVWVSAGFPLTLGFLPGYGGRGFEPASTSGTYRRLNFNASPEALAFERANDANSIRALRPRNQMTFDAEVNRAVRALNNADLAIYAVDARGLSVSASAWTNIGTMKELSERTGGRAYYNRNDIRNSIREAVADASLSYAVAYYAKDLRGDGKFRDIKVKVNRPGLVMRYRKGYFDQSETNAGDPAVREAALLDGAWSPLDATSIRVDVEVTPGAGKLLIEAKVDPAGITLEPRNGRWFGKLDVFRVQMDAHGNILEPLSRTVTIDATEETVRAAQKNGMFIRSELVPRPEVSTIKILVRDAPTGNLGSVTVPYTQIAGAPVPK